MATRTSRRLSRRALALLATALLLLSGVLAWQEHLAWAVPGFAVGLGLWLMVLLVREFDTQAESARPASRHK